MNKPIREPHFACENGACSEEVMYPYTMLNVYEGRLWCENCWDYDNPLVNEGESEVDWSDLDNFVPEPTPMRKRKYGMTPKCEPMPQTIEEWKHLVDLDEVALHKLVTEIGVLKAKVSRLTQQNDSLRDKQSVAMERLLQND